jgi:galacturan 1,4-alpha-galacturonidase
MQIKHLLWLVLLFSGAALGQDTCTPTSAGDSSVDDVPAISKALSTCGNGGTIVIPADKTFMIRTPLNFANCSGCIFQIEGTLKVSDDLGYWEGRTAFFMLENTTRATFHSLTGSGLIDGSGQKFWDYFASNNTYIRPYLIYFTNASNIIFTNLKVKDAPFWFIFVTGNSINIKFTDLIISAVTTSRNRPANTDGFDTGECTNVSISNTHVTNGDDCVSFKNGSNYIRVDNITCIGSHGLSVGSLGEKHGSPYIVTNVYASNAKMINCSLATRIKFFPGGPSHGTVFVSNVTYQSITVDNCDYAFQMDNCYESNSTECKKYPSAAKIFDIHFIDVTGKTSNKYDPVVAKIECPENGTCDLTFLGWNIVSPSGSSTVLCSNYDHPSGITCTPGNFA